MLPTCRTAGDGSTLPRCDLGTGEGVGCLDALRALHAAVRECCGRREPRAPCLRSLVGQGSGLERTSIEPIAWPVDARSVRAMHRWRRDGPWDAPLRLQTSHRLVAADRGESAGGLLLEETGCPKKGREAVGGARPYCGTLGKVAHGPGGGLAA